MSPAPARKQALWFALVAAAALLAVVWADAARDAAAIGRARAALDEVGVRIGERRLDRAAPALRTAGEAAGPVLDGSWARHAWTRAFRRGESEELRRGIDAAVALLDREVAARQARIAALQELRSAAGGAATIASLDAAEARRAALSADLESESPEAHAELRRILRERRAAFEMDRERNRAALADMRVARERARGDAAALQRVLDSVLPAQARAGEDAEADALRRSVAEERTALLASQRIDAALAAADAAFDAESVAAVAAGLASDEALLRGIDESLLARRAAALARIAEREGMLRGWAADARAVDAALDAGEPGAAVEALGRLRPFDPRTTAVAEALRREFGRRAIDSLARGAMSAIDRADSQALRRLAGSFAPGSPLRAAVGERDLPDADRAVSEVERAIDRVLYDEFRRSPSDELAGRYLEGWPAVRRAMAPAVMRWRRDARDSPTLLSLVEVRWGTLGTRAAGSTLEDRPDAELELLVDGRRAAGIRIADIRERASTGLNDVAVSVPGHSWAELEVGIDGSIDLRDAILSDPRPRGSRAWAVGTWRAARAVELAFADPAWPGVPHVAVLRVVVAKTPSLPPFQGRQR